MSWPAILSDETSPDTLLNPVVIFEVAPRSILHDDRGWGFARYRHCETVQDYLLVAQDRPVIEHYARQEQGGWGIRELSGLNTVLRLPSLGCELPLAQIYARVTFEPDPLMPRALEMEEGGE